jgi:hypothetical protein
MAVPSPFAMTTQWLWLDKFAPTSLLSGDHPNMSVALPLL